MTERTYLTLSDMQAWIDQHYSQWLNEYYTFLNFPSVSSESKYKTDLLDCAKWLEDYLKKMNFNVEFWETSGHPTLFASYLGAGPDKPTLLIYNHYDVQPIDPLDEWHSPPFQATLKEKEVYARGAQDNKGQCWYVIQALKLLQDRLGALPLNIKLCIEGEEEIGSQGLSQLINQKKEQLQADYLAIVDLGLREAQRPTLTLGIRGIMILEVHIQGSEVDLHSGSHGGIVPNPIHVLVKLLAGLHDEEGKVTIPDFYRYVTDISPEESSTISFEFNEKSYHQQTGAYPTGGEKAYSPLERAWIRPRLEINGIHGGYTGDGFKTVIPAKAYAKLSCRLVPNQQPEEIGQLLTSYFESHAPLGVRVSVHVHSGNGKAFRISPQAPIVKSFAKAFEEVFGKPCEFIFEGASIPIAAQLAETCGGETILLGLGLTTDQIHAPNEHFGVDRIQQGILIMAKAIEILAYQTGKQK